MKKVALVGRTNVGKSTLFNRLSSNAKAITMNVEGVTRDFIKDTVKYGKAVFELVDTAGVSLKKGQKELQEASRQKALEIIEESTIVLLVVDGTVGIIPEDKDLAKLMHKMGKEVIVVINKADVRITEEKIHEFERLGFKNTKLVSAQHGIGTIDLMDEIEEMLGDTGADSGEKARYNVVLLGKPNVGKSSLMNLILKKERAIVADIPGTTREALKETVKFSKESIQFTDTAGVRRKRSVEEGLETMMVKSSFDAVRQADIVLLLIDASTGVLSDQELKLAFYVFEEGKALILLFNKQDLTDEASRTALEFDSEEYQFFLKKIEQLNISCKTGKNVGRILPLVEKVWERYSQEFNGLEMYETFQHELKKRPLHRNRMPLLVKSVEQVKTAPPTVMLKVNESAWFGPSQIAFFENNLRKIYDLKSVPVQFLIRKKR
jgi:GTPase